MTTGLLTALFVEMDTAPASAAPPDTHWMATWNMQVGSDRWLGVQTLARDHSVVALQEVPSAPPGGAFPLGTNGNIRSYLWNVGGDTWRYLYILDQPSRNLGIVTSFHPDQVMELRGGYRSALAVINEADSTMFASIHAASNGGRRNDAANLVGRVARAAFDEVVLNYVVLGDFNRSPNDVFSDGLPADALLYTSGQATQQNSGELDYLVSNVETENWQASVLANQGSDHWPVAFSAIRAAAGPRDLTIHAANSGRFLDVYGGQTANGTHVIIYHPNGGVNQHWKLRPLGLLGSTSKMLYRIVTDAGDNCLDVDHGQASHQGNYLNVWDCHNINGAPTPGGYQHDTQNFSLEHPNPRFPNQIMLRDNSTGLYVNVRENRTGDGTWLIQWPYQADNNGVVPNEIFHLHPEES